MHPCRDYQSEMKVNTAKIIIPWLGNILSSNILNDGLKYAKTCQYLPVFEVKYFACPLLAKP